MKSVVKPLSILTTILYVAGIITTAIFLYKLPGSIAEQSTVLDLESLNEISPVLNQTFLVIGIALSIGLFGLFLNIIQLSNTSPVENRTEKFQADADSSSSQSEENTEEQYDTSALSEEILQKIKEAAKDKSGSDKTLETALRLVCNQLEASQGAVYVASKNKQTRFIEMRASYAYMKPDSLTVRYEFGEGLAGQVAKEGRLAVLDAVPDGYIKILSGLGQATPRHSLLIPVKSKDEVIGVVEIASFTGYSKKHQEICTQAFAMLAEHFIASSKLVNTLSEPLEEELEDNRHNL